MKYTYKQKEVITHLENLIHKRYFLKDLEKEIQELFVSDTIKLEDSTDFENDDEKYDYNLVFGCEHKELYGYFDIYYLKMRNGMIYITEVAYEFE